MKTRGTRPSALAVFCGSKVGLNEGYADAAAETGRMLGENDIRLVYGGGSLGLMGIVTEAALQRGGRVTGVAPRFMVEYGIGEPEIDELIVVESMHERKQVIFDRSDGFIVLPGGIGTMDEVIEMITWRHLMRHNKPIVLLSVDSYWDDFQAFVARTISQGFADNNVWDYFTVVGDVEQILPAICAAQEPGSTG